MKEKSNTYFFSEFVLFKTLYGAFEFFNFLIDNI